MSVLASKHQGRIIILLSGVDISARLVSVKAFLRLLLSSCILNGVSIRIHQEDGPDLLALAGRILCGIVPENFRKLQVFK